MTTTVADIIVTPATVWIAPAGTALPDETTIAFGAAWGGTWTDMGGTLAALTMAHKRTDFDVKLEQFTGVVKRFVTEEEYIFETMLAQLTPTQLAKLLQGTNTATAAGAAQRGFDELVAGGEFTLTEYVVGCEGRYRTSTGIELPVRAFLTKATIMLNGNLQFAKAGVSGVPFQARSLVDTTAAEGAQQFKLHRITAQATTEA